MPERQQARHLALPLRPAVGTILFVRQLPEQCDSCKEQIATLETCFLPDGTKKRGAEVTFKESVERGIRCLECAGGAKREGPAAPLPDPPLLGRRQDSPEGYAARHLARRENGPNGHRSGRGAPTPPLTRGGRRQ
jgi:hypothetical protein